MPMTEAEATELMARYFIGSFSEQPDALLGMAAALDFTAHLANQEMERGTDGDLALRHAMRFVIEMTTQLSRIVPKSALYSQKMKIAEKMPGCDPNA